MDTLTISKNIEKSGIAREQAETIAKSIVDTVNEHNSKLSTKRDLYFLGAIMVIAFGYVFSLLNTIITKLG